MFCVGRRDFIATKSTKTPHLCHCILLASIFKLILHFSLSFPAACAIAIWFPLCRVVSLRIGECNGRCVNVSPANFPFHESITTNQRNYLRLDSVNRKRSERSDAFHRRWCCAAMPFEFSSFGQVVERWTDTLNEPNSCASHLAHGLPSFRCRFNI